MKWPQVSLESLQQTLDLLLVEDLFARGSKTEHMQLPR
jgi:hypothetical protein